MEATDRQTLFESAGAAGGLAGRGAAPACVLRVAAGQDGGKQVLLGERPIVIGAAGECTLVLTDPKVSRRHVELRLDGFGVAVRDLGSTNGTRLGGTRISEAVVPIGSAIQIGETTLQLVEVARPTLPPSGRSRLGALVGESVAMREVFAILERVSPSEATVLLQGESGTGKELAARAVHDHSPRAGGPFVVVDCGAATESLLDSQLFGHTRGAFTGAVGDRRGAFVQASGGTLFLDEVGELPAAAQVKLLRALESRTVQPLGADSPVRVDIRVVAATHRDLHAMVAEKSFRLDLFQRLAVVHVLMPPLRGRPEDLPSLIRHFYEGRGVDPGPIEGDSLTLLTRHAWAGNVRELRNALERAWVLSGKDGPRFAELLFWLHPATAAGAEAPVDTSLPFKEAKEMWVDSFARRYLAAVYARFEGNITRAAEHAGINRHHFRELLNKYGLGSR